MSWFSSWLPELPALNINFTLPTSIQGRFLSFVLKKTLGHFLKPGQLDVGQIDSQIGSGFVQVKDLELDSGAINALLSGLPLTFTSGTLSSATVRIPWPNPLTSSLGFSIDSLHLTFQIVSTTTHFHPNTDIIASSVASVAESFLHEELTPREEASLLSSLHSDFPGAFCDVIPDAVPGGLDPFEVESGKETRSDADSGGISLFATLIERLLSRFEFDAHDISVTIIHPHNARFTLTLSEIKYSANPRHSEGLSPSIQRVTGVTRSLIINGIALGMKDLQASEARFPKSTTSTPPKPAMSFNVSHRIYHTESPCSSSSSLDEQAAIAMSQSLASLPLRPQSPHSIASSMYQSTLSAVNEADDHLHGSTNSGSNFAAHVPTCTNPSIPEETVFSSGAKPITFQVGTAPSGQSDEYTPDQRDKVKCSLYTGLFICVLRPWHIRGLCSAANALLSKSPGLNTTPPKHRGATATPVLPAFDVEFTLGFRGLLVLLLPTQSNTTGGDLQQFFLHPLVPPSLPSTYLRLHIEGVTASLILPSQPSAKLERNVYMRAKSIDFSQISGTFAIHNLNVFGFPRRGNDGVSAFPVLFTDPHLPNQYSSRHPYPSGGDGALNASLPDLDVLDWTNPGHQKKGAARLSYWRCKQKAQQQTSGSTSKPSSPSPSNKQENLSSPGQDERAISVKFHKTGGRMGSQFVIEGTVMPLHVLLDLEMIIGNDTVIHFLDEALQGLTNRGDTAFEDINNHDDGYELDDVLLATSRFHHSSNQEDDKMQFERPVLEDLDLDYDFSRVHERARGRELHSSFKEDIQLSLHIAAIRLEVRVPPPRNIPRSGALVVDIRNIEIRNGIRPINHHPHPRFSESAFETSTPADNKPTISAECDRILIGYSLVGQSLATALLSLGPLGSVDDVGHLGEPISLRPRVSVIESRASSSQITALNIELPSAYMVITKELLDGLQYFIDDASQLFERFTRRTTSRITESGDTILIGSRFFFKSKSNSSSISLSSKTSDGSETVVKVALCEAFFRAWVPRADTMPRPFDVFASETSMLLELKPEGKDETVITLGVLDIKILNMLKAGKTESLLQLTAPRSLVSAPRPLVKLRFASLMAPGTSVKETRVKLTLSDFTCNLFPDIDWVKDLDLFAKSPPGTFESVIPSERTIIMLKVMDGSICAYAPTKPGAVILSVGDADLSTEITGDSLESTVALEIQYLSLLASDDTSNVEGENCQHGAKGVSYWKSLGYALVAEVAETNAIVKVTKSPPTHIDLSVDGIQLHLHLAADTLESLSALISDIASTFKSPEEEASHESKEPTILSEMSGSRSLMASVEDIAFQRPPEIGPAPDMIYDDLPTNPEYLDESYGTAAGLREFSDDELDELEGDLDSETEARNIIFTEVVPGCASSYNGETIKVHSEGINIIEEYYDNLPAELSESPVTGVESKLKIRIHGGDAKLLLYDGYDWNRTRKVIEEEVKEMRRRLAKIRQLVANGQVQECNMDEATTVLFNSVYIGIDHDIDMAEPGALIAAIDEELGDDAETATQSSWQSLRPTGAAITGGGKHRSRASRAHGRKLMRSKGPSMEFKLMGLNVDMDQFHPDEILVSKTFATIRDVEILDHIRTSTWKKFLTSLRSDSRGNIRETDSDMVRIELRGVRPCPGHPSEEVRLRAKILPLRLYVDQDAVDFLKKIFSFKDPLRAPPKAGKPVPEAYIQLAEIFPVDLKLDYKPRRVDYRALREGRTIELMNFFHFDGAEMTLRHITLAGITGWPRLFEMLNDLWTPDVKATQLVDVISGVSPIRSMVNVGSGVADLVLLPISQYKKDGRIVRGMQKGATAFVKSTAIEAIKLGARLATGTQVILEQAENVLGGQFSGSYMTESLQVSTFDDAGRLTEGFEDTGSDLISKYAEQPTDIREGVQSAYQSLRRNLNSAAQTILAIPMEVYERSGNEGPVRSVIRAVPIAVLKPMIGASEAISKTLLGLHNTLDPDVQRENAAKYKHR